MIYIKADHLEDGLYNIKDGKIFKYKAKGGKARKYEIIEQTEPKTAVIIGTPSHEFKLKNGQTGNEPMLTIATDYWHTNAEDEPQTDVPVLTADKWKQIKTVMPESRLILFDDEGNVIEPQTERSE